MRKMGNILIQFRMINTVNNFLPQPSLFYLCSKQVAYLSVQLFNNLLSVVVRLTLFLSPSVNAASFSIVSLQVVCSGEWLAITEGHSSTHSNNHASTVTVLLFVEVLHFFFSLPKLNNELLFRLVSTGDRMLLCIADMQVLIFTDQL